MKQLIFLGMIIFIQGCVTAPKYIPPDTNAKSEIPKESIIINKSIDEVWDKLLKGITKSFFVINNIEKASGFINLSYTGSASNYVDCGYYTNNQKEKYYLTQHREKILSGTYRINSIDSNLQGRINILAQDIDANKTSVTVTTRYIVTISRYMFEIMWGGHINDNIVVTFDTGQVGSSKGINCISYGLIEKEVLSIVEGIK
jgi:hypothetical protein